MKFFRQNLTPSAPTYPSAMQRRGAHRQTTSMLLTVVAIAILLLLTALASAVVALGSYQLTIVVIGVLVMVPVIWLVRVKDLLPLMFVYIFIIQGIAEEFFKLRFAVWMGSALAIFFLARALLEVTIFQRPNRDKVAVVSSGMVAVCIAAGVYLACFFFGMALGSGTIKQNISALRFGLPMFGILLAMYCIELPKARMRFLWGMVVVIAVLQLPLVIYQHFFGMGLIGWDAVVGSFGHGMSPVLVLFSLAAMLFCVACWVRGIMPGWLVLLVFLVSMGNILLGEVKAVALWLPLGLLLIMRKRVLKNIVAFLMYSCFIAIFMSATFVAYKSMYWGDSAKMGSTVGQNLGKAGGYFFDPYEIKYGTGEVSRIASLYLWYRDPLPPAVNRLIGYGPGASQIGEGTGYGVVAMRYRPLQINATALSMLLWDVGILGALSFILLIACGVGIGWRYVRNGRGTPWEQAVVDTSMVMLVLMLTSLVYNRTLLDTSTVQLLCFFCLGCIVQYSRFGRHASVPAVAHDA